MKILIYRYQFSDNEIYSTLEKYTDTKKDIIIVEGENFSLNSTYNKLYEFSGYLDGINRLGCKNTLDALLVMNDTVLHSIEKHNIPIVKSTANIVMDPSVNIPILHGILDNNINLLYESNLYIPINKHIRSNIFIINRPGIDLYKKIYSTLTKEKIIDILNNDIRLNFAITSFLNNDYHKKISNLERKKVTIYLELVLTSIFYENGIITFSNEKLANTVKVKIINRLKKIINAVQ